MKYAIGDEVVLKVLDSFGYNDTTYRNVKVQVIGYDASSKFEWVQYLCYVPPYESHPQSFTINRQHVRALSIDPKFLGDNGCFITSQTLVYQHIPTKPGECCDRCGEFCEGATRSADDVYRCRACRENPYR